MKLKIKPTKNTVTLRKLKFRKESDFNKFLKIVSKNTKDLESIKLPSKSDVKKKSGFNLLPILALGALIAALAGLSKNKKGGGDDVTESSTANVDIDGLGKLPLPTTAKFPNSKISKLPGSKLPGSSSTTSIVKNPPPKTNILTRGLKTARTTIRNLLPNTKKILPPSRTNSIAGRNIKNITPNTQKIKNFISELNDRKSVRTIKEGIKTAKFLNPATLSNPYTLVGSLIMMDITKGHGLSEKEWNEGPGTLAYERNLQREQLAKVFTTEPGTGFQTEAAKRKANIDKEIDQLILTRSQLDPKDRRTYQHLTTKIEELLVQSAAITPKALEQKFIKDSFTNPVIFYPIDSESSNLASSLLNAPNFYSPPQSQSQTGNNVIDGESDVVNISELFLLNKLSH